MDEKITFYKGKQEQNVPVEYIRTELSQYFQIENLNILLGAGCSSMMIDQKEFGVSTMWFLYEEFFEKYPDFEIAGKKAKDRFDHNLEKMLDVMISIRLVNIINCVDDKIDEKIKQVQKYIREKVISGIGSSSVVSIYKNFYLKTIRKSRKAPVNIFTTNYDLYNEIALDELGFFYNNGFTGTYNRKFNPMSYNFMFVENMNLSREVWGKVENFYNLYKLHGSITWLSKDEQIWEKDYNFINDDDAVLIYPTPLKDRTTLMTPYSDLFRCMQGSLMKNNSLLMTIGYSFSDDHINRIILNALAIPTFRLIVVGRSDAVNKLIQLDDNRIIVINSDKNIHYFKRFVDELMPDMLDDVQEKLSMLDAPEAIRKFEGED